MHLLVGEHRQLVEKNKSGKDCIPKETRDMIKTMVNCITAEVLSVPHLPSVLCFHTHQLLSIHIDIFFSLWIIFSDFFPEKFIVSCKDGSID